MKRSQSAVTKRFWLVRGACAVALAGAVLSLAVPRASHAAAADDPAGTPPSGSPQPASPPAKSKQPTPKTSAAKNDTVKNDTVKNDTAKNDAAKPSAKTGASSAKPAGSQPRSLSGDLLDDQPPSDLDNQLLDGPPPAGQPPAKQPSAKQPGKSAPGQHAAPPADADQPPVAEGPVLGGRGDDPLFQIGEQMRTIERRLEEHRADDADTPKLQEQIVDGLAQLIEKLEQQQNSQQGASGSKTPPAGKSTERKSVRQPGPSAPAAGPADNRPAKESTERLGANEVRAPSADELRGLMKDVWGQLPAHEREQMLQSPPEQFLPKYELLLEKYYKRLADEQQRRP
ncbi:MAG TPA: hypothetical protein VGG30_08895 [Pirellulales bacterium]